MSTNPSRSGESSRKLHLCIEAGPKLTYQENSQYSILKDKGAKLSFEKEYYDIVRAGMLKWRYVQLTCDRDQQYAILTGSMQARIGGMDGIFVAYHNCRRLFGFQYLPM
jgi:hypothetical protein